MSVLPRTRELPAWGRRGGWEWSRRWWPPKSPERGPAWEWGEQLLSPVRPLPALQLLLWHSALWTAPEATPLGPARYLPETFLLKCLEQVRKIQADVLVMQERLVSEGLAARRVGGGERGPSGALREEEGREGEQRGTGTGKDGQRREGTGEETLWGPR